MPAAVQALTVSLAWPSEQAAVVRVVDGDTLVVAIAGREERVRLIGVDTPETVHPQKPVEYFGKEALAFTTRIAEGAIIAQGYGFAYTKDPCSKMEQFRQLEREARESSRGLWGEAATEQPASREIHHPGLERA